MCASRDGSCGLSSQFSRVAHTVNDTILSIFSAVLSFRPMMNSLGRNSVVIKRGTENPQSDKQGQCPENDDDV